jgi:hypothetical protein
MDVFELIYECKKMCPTAVLMYLATGIIEGDISIRWVLPNDRHIELVLRQEDIRRVGYKMVLESFQNRITRYLRSIT